MNDSDECIGCTCETCDGCKVFEELLNGLEGIGLSEELDNQNP